jgi:pimeloyl-ACP methyl ester carboxylesterase
LACRLDVATADGVAREAAIRLISADRPGIGLSDPQPGRTVVDWAADAEELAKHLGVERFAALGWSMGGQYAAAVGYALRSRVNRVAIIAGALPLDEPGVFGELPRIDRVYTRMSQRAPWVARQCFRTMSWAAGAAPALYGRLAARELGAADAQVIRDEGFETFARDVPGSTAPTVRGGRGVPRVGAAVGVFPRGSRCRRGRVGRKRGQIARSPLAARIGAANSAGNAARALGRPLHGSSVLPRDFRCARTGLILLTARRFLPICVSMEHIRSGEVAARSESAA